MTPGSSASYTFAAIRLIAAICALALSACATDSISRAELTDLSSSVRALRAENARLQSRLEKLEQQVAVSTARGAPQVSPPSSAVTRPAPLAKEELPALTVVKLKPKKDAAPKLATEVEVAEPDEAAVVDLRSAAPTAPMGEADTVAADSQFQAGSEALNTGNAEGGITQLLQFASDWPRHPKADNALYLAGLGMVALKDYEQAAKTFEQVVQKYPAGDAVLDSMLKLADCRVKLNKLQQAKATWERIVNGFPGTAAASQAQARLASLPNPSTAATP